MDMDAFFAAVEQNDNPRLKGKPVVIGADPKEGKGRGVVSTCSYEARKFGIHSAMPISQAYRLCPQAAFLRGSHSRYSEISDQIFRILYDFTPDIEPISIDEAFLDITGTYHFYKTPKDTCQKIRERVHSETGLTASIGIAPVKMVAKIASDLCKPDGLLEIAQEDVLNFLWPLPIEKLWGVGPKTKNFLNQKGIYLIGDLAKVSRERLIDDLGEHGDHLFNLANGIDERDVVFDEEVKSVGHEHTFEKDTSDKELVNKTLLHLSEKVSRRLRQDELKGRTVTLKVRLKGFKTYTRALTLPESTNFIEDIFMTAQGLFKGLYTQGTFIRLLGVRVTNFKNLYIQENLFEDKGKDRKERVHKAVDNIKDKFGERSIHRAT